MRRVAVAVALLAAACGHGGSGKAPAAPPPSWPVDVSTMPGNQMETTVAVDPRDGNRIAVAGNNDGGVTATPGQPYSGPAPGLLVATTRDGGRTWSQRIAARGGTDSLPDACCDPRLAWDTFGNLFLVYMTTSRANPDCALGEVDVVFAYSEDGGATFGDPRVLATGCIDQPKVSVAAGTVWVAYRGGANANILARGAAVHGAGEVEDFTPEAVLAGSSGGNFASVAVGAAGEVVVAYVKKMTVKGVGLRTVVRAHTDPDGLGPEPFDAGYLVSTTDVSSREEVAAQPRRSIDPNPQVAIDTSPGPRRGRAYVAYLGKADGGTRLLVRSSQDRVSWSEPVVVAPGDRPSVQLLPAIAVDPASGRVAVTYYDTVLDAGGGGGDTDGAPDTDTGRYAAVSNDGGVTFTSPTQLSRSPSNAKYTYGVALDYGDYAGMAFENGVVVAAWADNSDWTGGNPDGPRSALDVYVAAWNPSG